MASALYVNDLDLSLLGFTLRKPEGWADGLDLQLASEGIPGRQGQILLTATGGPSLPRQIQVAGTLGPFATAALLRAARATLKDRCQAGLVELRFADAADLMATGYLTRWVTVGYEPVFRRHANQLSLTFTCLDPLLYTRSPTVVGLSTVRALCPMGTAPSAWVLRIFGSATNPTVTYRASAGIVRQTMGFTITLGAGDYLEVDSEAQTISKSVSGTVTSVPDVLTSGSFFPLDPQDGDFADSAWPTLELSAGTGELAYRKSWS